MKTYTRPIKNCSIYASEQNPTVKPGEFIGTCIKVDGSIVVFRTMTGDIDRFIWRFPEGLNKFHVFGA